MKQIKRRIISVMLSLLMVLSFSMPALAVNANETVATSQKALTAIKYSCEIQTFYARKSINRK